MAFDIILHHKGSASRYRHFKISNGELADVRSVEVYKKCVQEINKSDVDGSWRDQLTAVGNCYLSNVKGGYIQEALFFPRLSICIWMNKQLQCLLSTPYHNRYLHIDATGGLVGINSKQTMNGNVNYSSILNYFLLVNDPSRQEDHQFQLASNLLPHRHITDNHDSVNAKCELFLASPVLKPKKKIAAPLPPPCIPTETSKFESREEWSKGRGSFGHLAEYTAHSYQSKATNLDQLQAPMIKIGNKRKKTLNVRGIEIVDEDFKRLARQSGSNA